MFEEGISKEQHGNKTYYVARKHYTNKEKENGFKTGGIISKMEIYQKVSLESNVFTGETGYLTTVWGIKK